MRTIRALNSNTGMNIYHFMLVSYHQVVYLACPLLVNLKARSKMSRRHVTRAIPEDCPDISHRVSRDRTWSYLHLQSRLLLLVQVSAINVNVCRMFSRWNSHYQAYNSFSFFRLKLKVYKFYYFIYTILLKDLKF